MHGLWAPNRVVVFCCADHACTVDRTTRSTVDIGWLVVALVVVQRGQAHSDLRAENYYGDDGDNSTCGHGIYHTPDFVDARDVSGIIRHLSASADMDAMMARAMARKWSFRYKKLENVTNVTAG